MNTIGQNVPRRDAKAKVCGRARYTDDIFMPGMLVAKIKRSTIAAGRVTKIDCSEAKRIPGVVDIFTFQDVPPYRFSTAGHPMSIDPQHPDDEDRLLLTDDIHYYGDEIAVVVASDELSATKALARIQIEYEECSPILSARSAMADGAREIVPNTKNVLKQTQVTVGNVKEGFEQADFIFEEAYATQMVQHCAMENHTAFAYLDEFDRICIVSSTQIPHICRRIVAQALGIPCGRIRVIKPWVGGGFGSKQDVVLEPLAAFLATKLAGRPVKLSLTREESFSCSRVRHPIEYKVKAGVTQSGKIISLACEAVTAGGGYASHGHAVIAKPGNLLRLLYPTEHYEYRATSTYTNTPVAGAMRGYGMPQATFMLEAFLDDIAHFLGVDPIAFREKNLIEDSGRDPATSISHSSQARACIKKGAELICWDQLQEKNKRFNEERKLQGSPLRRGVGMAAFIYNNGTYPINAELAGARVIVNQDATVQLLIGAVEIGQGSDTVFCQMAAEGLGIPPDMVYVVSTQDTDVTPYDPGAYASRQTYVSGQAVKEAALNAKEKILAEAERIFSSPRDGLKLENGKIYRHEDSALICTLPELMSKVFYDRENGRQICGEASVCVKSNPLTFGACFAQIEVDMSFGKIEVLDICNVHDSGIIMNPALAEAQVHGGISMGLGYALSEELLVDQETGRVLNGNLLDYKLPTIMDTPAFRAAFVEHCEPTAAFGSKSLGEPPAVPVAPAVRNALLAATGVPVNRLPLTPQRLLECFRRCQSERGD